MVSLHAVRPPVASSASATMPTPARRSGPRRAADCDVACAGLNGEPSAGTPAESCEVECEFMLREILPVSRHPSVDGHGPVGAFGLSELVGVKGGWGSSPNCNFQCLR